MGTNGEIAAKTSASDREKLSVRLFPGLLVKVADFWTYEDFAGFVVEHTDETDSKNPFLLLNVLLEICPQLHQFFPDLEILNSKIQDLLS